MGAVGLKTAADLRRRRLQAVAIALVICLASAAGTLALSVLVESRGPFERAFAAANGAHLAIDFAPGLSPASLSATSANPLVTAAAGPYPVTDAMLGHPKGGYVQGAEIAGRAQPDPSIDNVVPSAGRWWQAAGEAVLNEYSARALNKHVGDSIEVYPAPTVPIGKGDSGQGPVAVSSPPSAQPIATLTIVGIARSVSTPDVSIWTSPADVAAIAGANAPRLDMLYRVSPAATAADLGSALAHLTAALPADAVVGSVSYLDTMRSVDRLADLYVPVLLAFSIFALLAAGFSISNVVSGVVLTSRREIGVMKAIGFTPGEVTRILVIQIALPALVGSAVGVVVGAAASVPILSDTAASFGLPATALVPPEVIFEVLGASLGVAVLGAIVPALAAGRIGPVEAMTGDAANVGPIGRGFRRLGLRLPAALPLRLGVSTALAHPGRAVMTLGALVVGVAAVTFSLGLNASLLRVMDQLNRPTASPVRVELRAGDPAAVDARLAAQANTAHVVSLGTASVDVRGVGSIPFVGYREDASWIGIEMISGRWFSRPGEAVAPTNFFTVSGLHVGDSTELSVDGRMISVTLVGESFESAREGRDNLLLRGTFADLQALVPDVHVDRWELQPSSGTDVHGYWSSLQAALGSDAQAFNEAESGNDESFLLFLSVVGLLGLVLTGISLGGVFNTVLLETRQRSRELAILKAVGFTPLQVVAMVVASVVPLGLLAGLVGLPIGIYAQHAVLTYMGQIAAKTGIPASTFDVFGPVLFAALALAGLAIGATGAYVPAQRAARARIAPVLQAE